MLRRSLRLQRQLSLVQRANTQCCSWTSISSPCRFNSTTTEIHRENATPESYRQQTKLEQKSRMRKLNPSMGSLKSNSWKLTVGIEIHAQLDTEKKLFSAASTSASSEPNSQVALNDLAYPGAQPIFQTATLLPALRVALALNCEIQHKSSFDRKHYFYADQPAGYQITQFYEPFAKAGYLTLYRSDGIAKEDGESVTIGIKQIQLEQDTAKSLVQSDTKTLVDFNRVSHPLIEIISMPDIHHPLTAAAYVRKIQSIVKSVGAVTTGMEAGGLRADVNVSVRLRNTVGSHSYYGVEGLGQRTEIKNLNSFKAIEHAILAEERRHIELLMDGQKILGETRGWTLGGSETHKLREKEGEDDYRYMPDPDLGPLIIPAALIEKVKATMPKLPDEVIAELVKEYGLSDIDARTLINFDDGARVEYFYQVVHGCKTLGASSLSKVAKRAGNLILHEVGTLLTTMELDWEPELIPASKMSEIIDSLNNEEIAASGAKQLLLAIVEGNENSTSEIIEELGLAKTGITDEQYYEVIDQVIPAAPAKLRARFTHSPEQCSIQGLMGLAISKISKSDISRDGNLDHVRLAFLIRSRLVELYGRK